MPSEYPLLNEKAWLEKKYVEENLSTIKISKLVGCSKRTVLDAMRRFGIPRRNRSEAGIQYKMLHDEQWLRQKYLEEKLSYVEIGSIIGCTNANVMYAIKELNIPRRSISEAQILQKRPELLRDRGWLYHQYCEEELTTREIATILGGNCVTVLHALNDFNIPTRNGGASEGERISEETRRRMREARKHVNIPTHHTKPELIFAAICNKYNLPFKYTGDGTFWIHNINPDFVEVNGKKIAVEIFGDYWHSPLLKRNMRYNQTYEGRKKILKRYGWKLIVLWESDLLRKDAEAFVLLELENYGITPGKI